MPVNVLPHQLDVLRYWKHIKCAEEEPGIIPVRKEIVDIVASDVQKIWSSASIPTIELQSIIMRINVLIDSYSYQSQLREMVRKKLTRERLKAEAYQNTIDNIFLYTYVPANIKI